MHLLFVSESRHWSGGVNQMFLTGRELARRGHRVVVGARPSSTIFRRARDEGFTTRPLALRQDYDLPSALALKRLCEVERPDLVHAHHPRAHAISVMASYLGMRVPLMVTRRVSFALARNPFSALKYRTRRVAHYVAVCRAARDRLVDGGVPPARVAVIPSGVEVERLADARQRHDRLPMKRPFRLGLVGHHSWWKGHEVALDAAPRILAAYPDSRFVFVGKDTERLRPAAEARGIGDAVELLGERRDVPDILAGLHLFLMPSVRGEGIATALIEAQCVGLPAVASDMGGIPDVLVHRDTGLLGPPGDSERLADLALAILGDPDRARAMGARGAERAARLFALPRVVDSLETLYSRVIDRSGRRHLDTQGIG